jgi:hypothetical protein
MKNRAKKKAPDKEEKRIIEAIFSHFIFFRVTSHFCEKRYSFGKMKINLEMISFFSGVESDTNDEEEKRKKASFMEPKNTFWVKEEEECESNLTPTKTVKEREFFKRRGKNSLSIVHKTR